MILDHINNGFIMSYMVSTQQIYTNIRKKNILIDLIVIKFILLLPLCCPGRALVAQLLNWDDDPPERYLKWCLCFAWVCDTEVTNYTEVAIHCVVFMG